MKKVTIAVILLLTIIPGLAFAASPWMEKTTWSDKAIGKLDFGMKNLFAGITEVYNEPKEDYQQKTNIFKGIGRGIAYAAADIFGGALHLITFPLVQVDIPLPENGVSFE